MTLPVIKTVQFRQTPTLANLATRLLVIIADESHIEQKKITSAELTSIDLELGGAVGELVDLGDFEGKWLQTATTLSPRKAIAQRLIVIGAGKKDDQLTARARQLGILIGEESQKMKANQVAIVGSSRFYAEATLREQIALGFRAGVFKYPNSNLSEEARTQLEIPAELTFVREPQSGTVDWEFVKSLGRATDDCRLLQDGPANIVTPKFVSEHAAKRAQELGISIQVWGADRLREAGFGAMMAVGGGSIHEPQFVVMEYKPQNFSKTLALVGKGLTYDSGGYSMKPATSQVGMKYDMSGAAVSLSAALAIAELKLPIRVFGIAALCENMVDSKAYRVNDIVTTYGGKTIEILNTDAEGRVVLADALSYTSKELKPDYIVEYSTLTGAMVVALGHYGAGVFSFPDSSLGKVIEQASAQCGEKVWTLPTWEEISEDIKGKMADVNNIGATTGNAGSIVAAMFLKEFTGDVPYAHVDIAGVSNDNMAIGFTRKTGSGYGVQLSVEIARQLCGGK
jgi:leucyl aminopeptidase